MPSTNNTLLPKLADISPNPSSSSSTHSATNDLRRPSQIESYGVHCQEPTCNLSDFLPFTCSHCHKSYCSSHRLPFTHDCASYDASKYDITAQECQWCHEVLKVEHLPQGRESDVNTVMEWHIQSGQCKVLRDVGEDGLLRDGKQTPTSSKDNASGNDKKNEKKCNFARCKNIMWVEMKCPQCRISYCPTHRETRSHKCGETSVNANGGYGGNSSSSGTTAIGKKSPTTTQSAPYMKNKISNTSNASASSNKTSPLFAQNPFSKLSLSNSKTSSGNTHTTPSATKVAAAAPSSSTNKTTPSMPNVIDVIKSKTTSNVSDMSASRRAAKERESAALALKNRAKKGLLSEDEKIKYATLQALEAQQGNKSSKDKDCCIS